MRVGGDEGRAFGFFSWCLSRLVHGLSRLLVCLSVSVRLRAQGWAGYEADWSLGGAQSQSRGSLFRALRRSRLSMSVDVPHGTSS